MLGHYRVIDEFLQGVNNANGIFKRMQRKFNKMRRSSNIHNGPPGHVQMIFEGPTSQTANQKLRK